MYTFNRDSVGSWRVTLSKDEMIVELQRFAAQQAVLHGDYCLLYPYPPVALPFVKDYENESES